MTEERTPRRLVAGGWAEYEANILPPTAPEVQRTETRRAFYAGAFWTVGAVLGAVSDEEEETPEDALLFPDLELEKEDWLERLKSGRA